MGHKDKVQQFILKVPTGVKMPEGVSGSDVIIAKQPGEDPVDEPVNQPTDELANLLVDQPANQPVEQAESQPVDKPQVKITESYLAAKLRQSEEEKSAGPLKGLSSEENARMADMWREMENKISFKAPKGAQLPEDFLQSLGLEGENVLISPRAVEVLKALKGRKKNG